MLLIGLVPATFLIKKRRKKIIQMEKFENEMKITDMYDLTRVCKSTPIHLKGSKTQSSWECFLDTVCVVCLYFTNPGSLWIMFLRVVQECRHVVVQISLETVDQVPASTYDSLLKTTDVCTKQQKSIYPNFCLSGKDLSSLLITFFQQVMKNFLRRSSTGTRTSTNSSRCKVTII